AQCRHTGRPAALHVTALGQHFARRWGLGSKRRCTGPEALTPLPSGPKVDMHEARSRVEAEALEADRAGRLLEGYGIVVRHGDVEGRAVEMLRARRTADGPVVLRAAVGRTDDERLRPGDFWRIDRHPAAMITEIGPAFRAVEFADALLQRLGHAAQ